MSYTPVPGFEHVQRIFHRELERTDGYRFGRGNPRLKRPEIPSLDRVLSAVESVTMVARDEILSTGRRKAASQARGLFMLVARQARPDLSLGQLSQFTGRTRENLWQQTHRARKRYASDAGFRLLYERIDGALGFPCDG